MRINTSLTNAKVSHAPSTFMFKHILILYIPWSEVACIPINPLPSDSTNLYVENQEQGIKYNEYSKVRCFPGTYFYGEVARPAYQVQCIEGSPDQYQPTPDFASNYCVPSKVHTCTIF